VQVPVADCRERGGQCFGSREAALRECHQRHTPTPPPHQTPTPYIPGTQPTPTPPPRKTPTPSRRHPSPTPHINKTPTPSRRGTPNRKHPTPTPYNIR
jgi:hypothetical protein